MACGLLLLLTAPASAHRLDAQYEILRGGKVRIECWFETGDAPKAARVTVLRAGGEPLFPGPALANEDGVFIFPYHRSEMLRVEIAAGQGHHKILEIPADKLTDPAPGEAGVGNGGANDAPPSRERIVGPDFQALLTGVAFVLALGGFVLSVLLFRQVSRLKRLVQALERRLTSAETRARESDLIAD